MEITNSSRILVVLFVAAFLLAGGCGKAKKKAEKAPKLSPEESRQANELKTIGLAYVNYLSANGEKNGPVDADDLARRSEDAPHVRQAIQGIKSGKYVISWNLTHKDMFKSPRGMSGTILGYVSDVPTAGGMVLMGNGSVRKMTAAEFQSTLKASSK